MLKTDNLTRPSLSFIHRYVPAEPGGLPITLLLLHGTGGDETSLLPIAADMAPGTAVLSPRGKTVIEDMRRFFPVSSPGHIDQDELNYAVSEIAGFVQDAAGVYGFDPRRVVALAYSNGGAMAASLLLQRPRLLAGAVILRPLMPPLPPRLPDLAHRPVLIHGGRQDDMVSPQDAGLLGDTLRAAGADVTLHIEGAGHKLRPAEFRAVKDWLAEHFA